MTLAVEQYGPIGLLLVYLHRQQEAIQGAVRGLAEEIDGVDPENVEEQMEVV